MAVGDHVSGDIDDASSDVSVSISHTSESRAEAWVAVGATVVALLPVIVTVLTRAGRHYLPTQDFAVLDLRVRDVWSRDIPLVGAYSRFGWNHPGPAMYWLIAPLSFLSGKAAWATLVGSALLQGVAIALTGWVAWKLGRLPLTLGALGVQALAYGAMGPWVMLQPWNPHAAYPYFVLFALLVWAAGLKGSHWWLGAALAGSFLVQTHIGYLPFVVVGAVWVVVCTIATARSAPGRTRVWSDPRLWWTVAVVVVMWLPPIVQQLANGRDGNVARLFRYFVLNKGTGQALGFSRGAGIFAAEFRLPPPWLGGSAPTDALLRQAQPVSSAWLLVGIGLVVFGLALARKLHDRNGWHAVLLSAAFVATAIISVARVRGAAENYLFYWRAPVAIMLVASVVGVLLAWVRAFARWRVVTLIALAIIVALPSVALAVAVARAPRHEPFAPTAQRFIDTVAPRAPHGPVLVRYAGSTLLGLEGAVVDELDRRGIDVRVDKDRGFQFGEGRAANVRDVNEVWYAIEDGVYMSLLASRPDATVLAAASPLSPTQEQELRNLQIYIANQLEAAHRSDLVGQLDSSLVPFALANVPNIDQAAVARIGELNKIVEQQGPCRCGIISFPAAAAPSAP